MKTPIPLIPLILGVMLIPCSLFGQAANPVPAPGLPTATTALASSEASLTRFDLDFPGGKPDQLVRAIEKASGKPLNAIIPTEHADVQLPPLKMKNVSVPRLFEALIEANRRTIPYVTGFHDYGPRFPTREQVQGFTGSFGFRTQGPVKEDSVWVFFYDKPPVMQKPRTCRFYQLVPHLETYKVEDITTAIQTGWKMLGETSPPTISYHKDTKLLIAVGEADKLQVIDDVLARLSEKKKPEPTGSAADKSGKTATSAADK